MATQASSILDHLCPDDDTKMKVFTVIDYEKRGWFNVILVYSV